MKQLLNMLAMAIVLSSCSSTQSESNMENFRSEKVSRTASFTVDAEIGIVFPLFGAFEERKWERAWNPKLIYPEKEVIEEGTTFKTQGAQGEAEYLWRVSKYDPTQYLIQYLVSTPDRYWTITVQCSPKGSQTMAEVTYCYIGLNSQGNELNRQSLDRMYKNDLKDWEKAINYFLKHGEAI